MSKPVPDHFPEMEDSADEQFKRRGDGESAQESVQRLFLMHSEAIRAYVCGLVPPQIDAEEIFQDTFLVVTRKADQYWPEADYLSWVFSIARREVLHGVRSYQRQGGKTLSNEVLELLAEDGPESASLYHKFTSLQYCMGKLTASSYRLLKLFYFEGLSAKTIAERSGIKPQSVYNGLDRIRQRLRQCIEQELARE